MSEEPRNYIQKCICNCLKNFNIIKSLKYNKIRKVQQLRYLAPIEKLRRMKTELLNISKKVKDIFIQSNLDFSNAQSIQCFLEHQTNMFDKYSAANFAVLTPYLRNINKKIIQKVNQVKTQTKDIMQKVTKKRENKDPEIESVKKITGRSAVKNCRKQMEIVNTSFSMASNGDCTSTSIKCRNIKEEINKIPIVVDTSMSQSTSNSMEMQSAENSLQIEDLWWIRKRKNTSTSCNLNSSMIQYLQRKTELNTKYLQLHVRDINFVQENVHITLHIGIKDLDTISNFRIMKSKRQQVRILCKQAILSLIEPSENAFVRYEKDLPKVINNYLTRGYKYHFGYLSEPEDFYWSLLVLSHWAELLVKHPDTTLMHTISCVLGCYPRRILVLSYPKEREQDYT